MSAESTHPHMERLGRRTATQSSPDSREGQDAPIRSHRMIPEPLRRCVQCGALVYLSQRCRFIGILHPAPDYVRHEES